MKTLLAKALKDLYSGFYWKKTGRKIEYAKEGELMQIHAIRASTALCKFNNGYTGWVSLSDIKFLEDEEV